MFYQGKKVLVTGGTGFIGSHFVKALLQQGAEVRVPIHNRPLADDSGQVETLAADLNDPADCLRVCQDVDFLFHAAGAVSASGMTVSNPMSAITDNLILTARILEAAWGRNVKRVLIFSSGTTAYPAADYPIKEDEMWSGPPPPVYFGYGWMRRYLELLSEFVASKSNMALAICRPTAVYGRHDDFNPQTGHVIPALIRRACRKEDPFIVWGTGDEQRDFLHVTDLVRGCLLLLAKHAVCDPVNIGYGKSSSIKDVVRIILKAAGHEKANLAFDPSKPTTIPVRKVDTSKAKEVLGFQPELTLEDGLADTVVWYTRSYLSEETSADA